MLNTTCRFPILLLIASIVLDEVVAFSVISHNGNQVPRTTDQIGRSSLSNAHQLQSGSTTTTTTCLFSDYLSSLSTPSTPTTTKSKKSTTPKSPKSTTHNRLQNKTLPNGQPNYSARLNERLNTLSTSNEQSTTTFSPARMTYTRAGPTDDSQWKCAFVEVQSSMNISSGWMSSKKKAKQDASRRYLEWLDMIARQAERTVDVPTEERKVFVTYGISDFSEVVDATLLTPAVEELIEVRDGARSDRDYNTADEVRVQLWKTYRVAVDDISKTWSLGGDFGPKGTFRWTDDGPINPRKVRNDDVETAAKKVTQPKATKSKAPPSIQDRFDLMEATMEVVETKSSKGAKKGSKTTKDAKQGTNSSKDGKQGTKSSKDAKQETNSKVEDLLSSLKKVTESTTDAKKEEPKSNTDAKKEPKSKAEAKKEPKSSKKGAKKEPKSSKKEAKKEPKSSIKEAKMEPKSSKKEPKKDPKSSKQEAIKVTKSKPPGETDQETKPAKGDDDDIDEARAARQLEAKNQPKSPEVEAQLQAKYAAIEDLGERAHTICYDLGIV